MELEGWLHTLVTFPRMKECEHFTLFQSLLPIEAQSFRRAEWRYCEEGLRPSRYAQVPGWRYSARWPRRVDKKNPIDFLTWIFQKLQELVKSLSRSVLLS